MWVFWVDNWGPPGNSKWSIIETDILSTSCFQSLFVRSNVFFVNQLPIKIPCSHVYKRQWLCLVTLKDTWGDQNSSIVIRCVNTSKHKLGRCLVIKTVWFKDKYTLVTKLVEVCVASHVRMNFGQITLMRGSSICIVILHHIFVTCTESHKAVSIDWDKCSFCFGHNLDLEYRLSAIGQLFISQPLTTLLQLSEP